MTVIDACRIEDESLHTMPAFSPLSLAFAPESDVINPTLQRILDYLCPCPAFIADRRCNIVGWNKAASAIMGSIGPIREEERNIVWLSFMKQEMRDLVVNWEDFAHDFLTIFRNYYGQYAGDPWYDEFTDHCAKINPQFTQLWQQGDHRTEPKTVRELNHPLAGNMRFEITSFQVYANADLRCCVYTPLPDSETELKMRQLLGSMS
ncbi:hypothetical protein ACFQ88_15430 [Paenibacillus sp. NPDC056579]|uniref:MmyB family transcriptional regulator n=1 Tax=Paenibacillus sp. NPDC056579 TaxID=3345871 RepID=UPI0036C71EEE